MSAPVWVLSVDLQTKTASFQSGMADAARSARNAFQVIEGGAGNMAKGVEKGSVDVRHSLGLVDNVIRGAHAQAMADLVRMYAQSSAVMSALPIAATVAGLALIGGIAYELVEHLKAVREEGEKLTNAQELFQTTAERAFNSLDDKLLEAGVKADDLNHNHLGALQKQLELIDHESMADLTREFAGLAKATDAVFTELKGHWYELGIGSAGAQHALSQFKTQYDLLLAEGDNKGASDLLHGTLNSAQSLLSMMQQLRYYRDGGGANGYDSYAKAEEALQALRKAGISDTLTDKELQSQEALVNALNSQVIVEEKINALKTAQKANVTHATADTIADEQERALIARFNEQKRETEEEDRLWQEAHNKAVADLEEYEREKIAATKKGSAARLDAINTAIRTEETYGLQETAFYRELLTQRVDLVRQMGEEEDRLREEAAREAATHAEKMAQLTAAAQKEYDALTLSTHRATADEMVRVQIQQAAREHAVKAAAYEQQIAALDKGDKDYLNKKQALHDRELEEEKRFENQVTAIKQKAEVERNQRLMNAQQQYNDMIARGLTDVLMRHESFGSMILGIGDQIAAGMIQNAIKSMLADDMTKERDAAYAARQAFKAGMHFPFPANLVMAPVLAAGAFASVMAFAEGGIVPGVGRGDVVPAMLTPGEAVLPKSLVESLRTNAPATGGHTYTLHAHFAPKVTAFDAEGLDRVLASNQEIFQQHIENTMRKLNR